VRAGIIGLRVDEDLDLAALQPAGNRCQTRKMPRRWRLRETRREFISVLINFVAGSIKFDLIIKYMCVRCEPLKYVYGSSMCSFVATSLYVAVIIRVNIVVYAVCKCVRRFNSSPIHIKWVVFAKVLRCFLWICCS